MKGLFLKSLLILLSFPLFLFLASPARALNSPQKISTTTNDNLAPAIVTDSNGKVHTVWMDAPNGWYSSTTSLVHSFWNGNVWSTPSTIATGKFHELPSLAADNSGNVYATWDADTDSSLWQVYYSKYNGSTWSAPVAISGSNPGDSSYDSEIAIDSSGNPNVVYISWVSGATYIYYTKWNGSSWTTPINLSETTSWDQYPAISTDSTGRVHVVWKSRTDSASVITDQILTRFWNGSTWSGTTSLSGIITNYDESQPRMAIDNTNNVHVSWQEFPSGSVNRNILYSKWNGSTWSSPFTVSTVADNVTGLPAVAVIESSLDDVLIGWIDKSVSPFKLGFRKYVASSATWDIARSNNIQQASADFPVATMDKWDNIHVAWGELNTTNQKYDLYYDAIPLAANTIGSAGGTLTTFNGDTLTIPSGSLSQNTIISAQVAPLSQAAPSGSNTLNRQYIFEPSGQTFNPTISVVFKYTDAEVAGIDERTLGIYLWDPPTSSWVFKTGSINRAQNKITISLDHFSIYGIFGTQNIVAWGAPIKDKEILEVNKGKSIPLKFEFTQSGIDPSLVKLLVVNEAGKVISEIIPGSGAENLKYDPSSGGYIAKLKTDMLEIGNYQIKVSYLNLVRGSAEILLK